MKRTNITALTLIILGLTLYGCSRQIQEPQSTNNPSPAPSAAEIASLTIPELDTLLPDNLFIDALKAKLQLNDDKIAAVRKIVSDELAKSRPASSDNGAGQNAPARSVTAIRDLLGSDKTDQMFALALERRADLPDTTAAKDSEPTLLKGPNAVPPDTRIIVNIPAFRMDLFRDGTLLKSWRVGIGYQEYPLPTGFRKAEMIIFNPTWTQPNEPWASNPGEVVPAGVAGNPLGPIKIPIGGANLIHGGKALAKIGTFASHGCVGLTNYEVKDFTRVLADATSTVLKEETMV